MLKYKIKYHQLINITTNHYLKINFSITQNNTTNINYKIHY